MRARVNAEVSTFDIMIIKLAKLLDDRPIRVI